ncbi:MAG: DUF1501 domain-containing protein, partial [Proteobacteria bacterium]
MSLSKGGLVACRRFFCALILLSITACDRHSTPDWDKPGNSVPAAAASEAPKALATPAPVQAAAPATIAPPAAVVDQEEVSAAGLRFITYNVKNWLSMDRYVDRKSLKNAPKPDSEKDAVIALIVRHAPDAVGLCEIGTAEDLADVQQRLKSAGLDLPHLHYTGGSDAVRHLGFLSRFPITATANPENTEYKIQGKVYAINRGILDVSIEARGKPYHFIGVHLKSKREIEDGDQEESLYKSADVIEKQLKLKKENSAKFPETNIGKQFKSASDIILDDIPVSVIKLEHGSFDTHTNQRAKQDKLLKDFSDALLAFKESMVKANMWNNVLVITYSEFGRRAAQNGSGGTDHGTAAPHFITGGKVKGGFYGKQPELDDLVQGDLKFKVDYRNIYS